MFTRNFLVRPFNRPQVMQTAVRRGFSTLQKGPQVNYGGLYALGALGLGGLAFTLWKAKQMSGPVAYGSQNNMLQGQTTMSPLVRQRVGTTLGWFGYGLGCTAAMTYAIRNSLRLANTSPWLILVGLLGFSLGTHLTDYNTQFPLKVLMYTGMCGVMAVNILPLIQMSTASVIADAALATSVSMSAFAAVAYNAPSEEFMRWGGAIALLSGGMVAISLLGMFTGSRNLFNIWLYGGLAMSGIYTMYDTQKILHAAKNQARFDPISQAQEIYMDAIMFFIRFLMLFNDSKKK